MQGAFWSIFCVITSRRESERSRQNLFNARLCDRADDLDDHSDMMTRVLYYHYYYYYMIYIASISKIELEALMSCVLYFYHNSNIIIVSLGWWFGVAIMCWSRSSKLTYVGPG